MVWWAPSMCNTKIREHHINNDLVLPTKTPSMLTEYKCKRMKNKVQQSAWADLGSDNSIDKTDTTGLADASWRTN